ADRQIAEQAAEIGIMLLMFGVGMHFSPREFAAVRGIAAIGALAQIVIVRSLTFGLALLLGIAPGAAAIFGLALSVASTIVALRELEHAHALGSPVGQITIGWLVVEDIVTVVVLVILPILGPLLQSGTSILSLDALGRLGLSLAGVVVFVGLMLLFGRRLAPWFLAQVAATGSRELFTLATLSIGLGIALGAASL